MGVNQSLFEEVACCGPRGKGDEGLRLSDDAPANHNFATQDVPVPQVLLDFIAAREAGNVDKAAECCSADMAMVGPKGEFRGIEMVRERIFNKPSHPIGKVLQRIRYQSALSTSRTAVYAREFETQVGRKVSMALRQEFTVCDPGTDNASICRVEFKQLGTTRN